MFFSVIIAKQFGATEFVNPKEVKSVPEKLAELTDGGVDYCFVSVGIIAAMVNIAINKRNPGSLTHLYTKESPDH